MALLLLHILTALALLASSSRVRAQFDDCSALQESELGNTTALSTSGLLADALAFQSGEANLALQVLEYNTVCLGQGTSRDSYRSTALVVRYLQAGESEVISQLHLQCIAGTWSTNNFGSSQNALTDADGTLSTSLRTDCFLCLEPDSAPPGQQFSMEHHCLVCDSSCTGLTRCSGTSPTTETCCNFFDPAGACVTACPANSLPNSTHQCECVAGHSPLGSECVEDDECSPNPCDNGGTCTDLLNDFSCECIAGYTGLTCETNIDDCDPNPCQSGSSCTNLVDGFSCACPPGFTGPTCEVIIDNCDPDPCQNGGVCSDLTNTFFCDCPDGFSGDTCEVVVRDCSPDPCLNDGTCSEVSNDFECACAAGFTGDTCEVNIDDCDPDPCENGGSCTDQVDGFSCDCPDGFFGNSCESECFCDTVGSTSNTCDDVGQCPCKPGVGGLQCGECLPGYTDFGSAGCSPVVTCDCDPLGAVSEECDGEGVCECRSRVAGDQCEVCAFGYRDFTRGCTPCPACFDRVASLYNQTLELYRELLTQLNATLEGVAMGGVDSALLARVEEYRRRLEELLERAGYASDGEEILTSEHADVQLSTASLEDTIMQFLTNLTMAESDFSALNARLDISTSMHENLLTNLATLEHVIRMELRQLLLEAQQLDQEIESQLTLLQEVVMESTNTSLELQSQAETLVSEASLALENASLALLQLQMTISLQNQTRATADAVENSLISLEQLVEVVRGALANATMEAPNALSEATRVLEAVRNISLDLDLDSRQSEVAELENDVFEIGTFVDDTNLLFVAVQRNFSVLNASALEILTQSRALNEEARVLLNRTQSALLLANQSVQDGNEIINEAGELLFELQEQLRSAQNLSQDLDDVVEYVEGAEHLSLLAEGEAELVAAEIGRVQEDVDTAAGLLEGVSEMLTEILSLATQLNTRSDDILSSATALNASAADSANDIAMATSEADTLEQAVTDDRAATDSVTSAANTTVVLATDIMERITIVNATLVNLSAELNQTHLVLPERLQEAADMLAALQDMSEQNQELVDMLTDEIQRLQDSASELRERYTMLRQHRDLLQEILGNIGELNCREQFEA